MLVFGTVMFVGVLYVEWLDEFQLGRCDTALIGSIATGSVVLVGEIMRFLITKTPKSRQGG